MKLAQIALLRRWAFTIGPRYVFSKVKPIVGGGMPEAFLSQFVESFIQAFLRIAWRPVRVVVEASRQNFFYSIQIAIKLAPSFLSLRIGLGRRVYANRVFQSLKFFVSHK